MYHSGKRPSRLDIPGRLDGVNRGNKKNESPRYRIQFNAQPPFGYFTLLLPHSPPFQHEATISIRGPSPSSFTSVPATVLLHGAWRRLDPPPSSFINVSSASRRFDTVSTPSHRFDTWTRTNSPSSFTSFCFDTMGRGYPSLSSFTSLSTPQGAHPVHLHFKMTKGAPFPFTPVSTPRSDLFLFTSVSKGLFPSHLS